MRAEKRTPETAERPAPDDGHGEAAHGLFAAPARGEADKEAAR